MKQTFPKLFIFFLIVLSLFLVGCDFGSSGGGSGDGSSNDPPATNDGDGTQDGDDGQSSSDDNARFTLTLTSYAKDDGATSPDATPSHSTAASIPQNNETAIDLVTGTVLVVNQSNGEEETYNWALEIDESAIEVKADISLPLEAGVYDFYFLMSSGDRQYAAITQSWMVLEGTNSIPFLIHPVIGEQIPDIQSLSQVAEFQFQYDKDVVAQFKDPAFGISIDKGEEQIFSINPETGLSRTFVYLPAGTYDFALNFYDGALLKSVLLDSQSTITITENGGSIELDIVPLVVENTYTYDESSSSATFHLVIPEDVLEEAGGPGNVSASFSLTGENNQPLQLPLDLTSAGSNFEGTVVIPDFEPGAISWSLQIADTSGGSNDIYAYCGQTVTLGVDARTVSCDFTLLVRSMSSENPMSDLTVAVETNGYPIPGAVITAGNTFIGLTGNGENGTASGQLQVFLPSDSYAIQARSADGTRTTSSSIALSSGESHNLTLQLPAPPNNAPTTENVSLETEEGIETAISLPGTDPDPWDTISWEITSTPGNGTVSLLDNTALYTPDEGFTGTDQFTFTVSDGELTSESASVTIYVADVPDPPVNNPPTAKNISVSTDQNLQVQITLIGDDPDEGDTLSYAIDSLPFNGSVVLTGNTATYTPAVDFVGDVTFSYTVSDGSLTSNPATVTVTVKEVIDPPANSIPSAIDMAAETNQDEAVEIILQGQDADEEDILSYRIKKQPDYGTVSLEGNTAIYQPNEAFSGTDSFSYTVFDGTAESLPAAVQITVHNTGVDPEPEEDLELVVSIGFRPWQWTRDKIKLEHPVNVIIPSHDNLEILAGNKNRFVLRLKIGHTSCIYLGGRYSASVGGMKVQKSEKHRWLRSPICGHGRYQAGDIIEARGQITGRLLIADPRQPETTIRIKLETVE